MDTILEWLSEWWLIGIGFVSFALLLGGAAAAIGRCWLALRLPDRHAVRPPLSKQVRTPLVVMLVGALGLVGFFYVVVTTAD